MDNTHKRFQNISMQVKLITKNKPEPQIFQNLSVIKPTFFFFIFFSDMNSQMSGYARAGHLHLPWHFVGSLSSPHLEVEALGKGIFCWMQ